MNTTSQETPIRTTEHQRAYKACIPCRKRKAKCDLGGRDGPPCVRCRRELRECVFSAERSWKKRKINAVNDLEGQSGPAQTSRPASRRPSLEGNWSGQSSGQAKNISEEVAAQRRNASMADRTELMHHSDSYMENSVPNLANSVMRTVVSNGNDALNLLFQAATQDQNDHRNETARHTGFGTQMETGATTPNSTFLTANVIEPVAISPAASNIYKLWRSTRFVKMGWLSAEEAITYIDLFFKNMSPLSPVLTDFYADHANHHRLISQEPLLCCTILMISSRNHTLPGAGGASRGYFIHDRFWKHCEQLIMRLMFGQEKGSFSKVRTLGSIESMLLISEWHPRSLHFPPETDGWDSDLIFTDIDESDPADAASQGPHNRWLVDVVEPAKRSDRMSWMLLGCGLSLAHELNIFGDSQQAAETDQDDHLTMLRKGRARRLLYVYINQLASRLGTTSPLPQSLTHVLDRSSQHGTIADPHWHLSMFAWTELTRLLKSLSDMVFPTKEITQQLLQNGRYIGLLEHFQPLLEQWRMKYLDNQRMPELYTDVLFIEYQYVRIIINSIGMQAVCERAVAEQGSGTGPLDGLATGFDAGDQLYIGEVISGSCDMLQKVIALANKDALRFAPVRVFLRITTSSVFLIKAMSINVRNGQLRSALGVLHRSVQALRSSVLDDMHLANTFAVLLDLHVKRLHKSFLVSSKKALPNRLATAISDTGPIGNATDRDDAHGISADSIQLGGDDFDDLDWNALGLNVDGTTSEDDWLSLPFDPAMAPFGPSGVSTFPVGLDDDGLNFIWNLPA